MDEPRPAPHAAGSDVAGKQMALAAAVAAIKEHARGTDPAREDTIASFVDVFVTEQGQGQVKEALREEPKTSLAR